MKQIGLSGIKCFKSAALFSFDVSHFISFARILFKLVEFDAFINLFSAEMFHVMDKGTFDVFLTVNLL